MTPREIRHKIRDLRSRLCTQHSAVISYVYESQVGYGSPSLMKEKREIFLLEQIIDGYIDLLRLVSIPETEAVPLPEDIPTPLW